MSLISFFLQQKKGFRLRRGKHSAAKSGKEAVHLRKFYPISMKHLGADSLSAETVIDTFVTVFSVPAPAGPEEP